MIARAAAIATRPARQQNPWFMGMALAAVLISAILAFMAYLISVPYGGLPLSLIAAIYGCGGAGGQIMVILQALRQGGGPAVTAES